MAQSSPLATTGNDASGAELQLATAAVGTAVADAPMQPGNVSVVDVSVPTPNLEADPIPVASIPPADAAPGDEAAPATGPTAASATAGIHSLGATENLTRRQLADRAHEDQDGGRSGLGRDAVLMIVGGAAIVAGAIVGGGGGTALIVVGAVIGLTGLVLILS
jgi:hypothetical protein